MNGNHSLVQVPPGVQCFVGEEARLRRAIEEKVVGVFEGWDYEEIIPPLFDYADVFAGGGLAPRTYSFPGRDGSLLALRPDFTSLLAKIAAGRLSARPLPLRLYYSGEVLRYEPPRAGRRSELYQMGLEHLGGPRVASDGEVLAVAAECLEVLGVTDWVLALGHVGVFAGMLPEAPLEAAHAQRLRDRVESKDPEGVAAAARAAGLDSRVSEGLVQLTRLAGAPDVLDEADGALRDFPRARAAVAELRAVMEALAAAGLGARLAVDLGEVRGLDYYTGLVFRAYTPGLGFEVGGGGRYDTLLARFGRPLPAVGFMLGLDRLALLLERQGRAAPPALPAAEVVSTGAAGAALLRARTLRREGRRVHIGGSTGPEER
jgi:ATP phosphoribosyltransferase regulatory subunit